MLNTTPFAATNKATLDALMSLSATAFDGVQQLTALNLQVLKTSLDETAEASLALLSAKDPQALLALQTELMQPSAEKATAYGRQVVDILTQTKAEFERIASEQVSGVQKSIMSSSDGLISSPITASSRRGISSGVPVIDALPRSCSRQDPSRRPRSTSGRSARASRAHRGRGRHAREPPLRSGHEIGAGIRPSPPAREPGSAV